MDPQPISYATPARKDTRPAGGPVLTGATVGWRTLAGAAWLAGVLRWHPLMPPLAAVRGLFLDHALPPAATWVGMAAWPAAAVAVASAVLAKLRPEIRDVI